MAGCLGKQRVWMNFLFRGTGLPTVMRKNQPLVPRSHIAGSWARGGGRVPQDRFCQYETPYGVAVACRTRERLLFPCI